MDTSVSGGMAPALQSTNHQSTDLANEKNHSNGVKEISPAKTNGNGGSFEDTLDKNLLPPEDVPRKIPELLLIDSAAGDGSSTDIIQPEQTMTVKESFNLKNHKELKSNTKLSIVHVGQGDCPVLNPVTHNGWGNHKKALVSGVLQENNSAICNSFHNGMDPLEREKLNKIRKPTESKMTCKVTDCKESSENRPNGQTNFVTSPPGTHAVVSSSQNSMGAIATLSSVHAYTVPSTTCTCSNLSSDTNSTFVSSAPISTALTTLTSCSQTTMSSCQTNNSNSCVDSSHLVEANDSASTKSSSPNLNAVFNSGCQNAADLSLASQALKYNDLFNSDLLRLKEQVPNLSPKLANTLQELAASLKGAVLPIRETKPPPGNELTTAECNHTVICNEQERHRSVKSLDFASNLLPTKTITVSDTDRSNLESKIKTATENSLDLQKRLLSLDKKINSLRLRGMGKYIRRELGTIVHYRAAVTCKSKDRRSSNEMHKTDRDNTQQEQTLKNDSSKLFWQRVLAGASIEGDTLQWRGNSIDKNVNSIEHSGLSTKMPPDIKKEIIADDRKLTSSTVPGLNMDPIVQLTRMEQKPSQKKISLDLLEKARTNTGILKKELDYLMSSCDPDITDSSSDEETIDSVQLKASQQSRSRKGDYPTSTKHRKSFCKWAAERADIAKRWTWLQSRISGLEFSIRQQGELYRQLRDSKGSVQLDPTPQLPETTPEEHDRLSTTSPSYNVNQLLSNVHYHTSRLMDNMSPLSGGSPSPVQPALPNSPNMTKETEVTHAQPTRNSSRLEGKSLTAARTRPLDRSVFKHRKIVNLLTSSKQFEKTLKPKTVPNDSAIMSGEKAMNTRTNLFDSLALKAAVHDHSYHAVISSIKDLPLSVTMQAVMKSNRKWCRKPESPSRSTHRRNTEMKEKSKRHKHKKSKHKSSKRKDGRPMMPPSHSNEDMTDSKRRRLSSQVSEPGRKRPRGMSFDSDLESLSSLQMSVHSRGSNSGTSTPTHEHHTHQMFLKKKKSSEQAYDINNIVIPHGLTSARIEKLAYKEIQTPSWKVVEPNLTDATEGTDGVDVEDISQISFKLRHDNYEIMEKRKYMAYMEWSMSKKGRGSRMSSARGSITPESISPASPSFTGHLNYSSDQPSTSSLHTTGYNSLPQKPLSQSPPSPSSNPGVRTRRMSSDQNRPMTPLSHLHAMNQAINTSAQGQSSPNWQEGLGSRRGSSENTAAPLNSRSLSDNVNSPGTPQEPSVSWEARSFPLQDEDFRMLEDIELALQKLHHQYPELRGNGANEDGNCNSEGEEGRSKRFRTVSRQGSTDGQRSNGGDLSGRTFSVEAVDHHHIWNRSKSVSGRRRRTDSRASSHASYDDAGRHSDASNASASSSVNKKRRKLTMGRSRSEWQQRRDLAAVADHVKTSIDRAQAWRKNLELRLSESENTSDGDSDNSNSSDDTSTSYDDAGHLVDDFADPEWDVRTARQKS